MKKTLDLNQPAKSFCLCGHTGDGANSAHGGLIGHGACMTKGCTCIKFTWARFIEPDHFAKSFPKAQKAGRDMARAADEMPERDFYEGDSPDY